MSFRPVLPLVALAVVLLLPNAAAQFAITVEAPASGPTVEAGGEGTAQVSIKMASTATSQFVCAQEQAVTVAVTPTKIDEALGLGGSVSPATVSFSIPPGAYIGGATPAWQSDTQSVTFTAMVGDQLPRSHTSHTYGVKASYDGAALANCQSGGGWTATDGSADIPVTITFPPEPTNTASPGTTGGTGTGSPTPTDTKSNDSPAPAPLVVAFGIVAFLALVRRR